MGFLSEKMEQYGLYLIIWQSNRNILTSIRSLLVRQRNKNRKDTGQKHKKEREQSMSEKLEKHVFMK